MDSFLNGIAACNGSRKAYHTILTGIYAHFFQEKFCCVDFFSFGM